jgi:hypothetical protein
MTEPEPRSCANCGDSLDDDASPLARYCSKRCKDATAVRARIARDRAAGRYLTPLRNGNGNGSPQAQSTDSQRSVEPPGRDVTPSHDPDDPRPWWQREAVRLARNHEHKQAAGMLRICAAHGDQPAPTARTIAELDRDLLAAAGPAAFQRNGEVA